MAVEVVPSEVESAIGGEASGSPSATSSERRGTVAGVVFGTCAAVGYTLTNIALREAGYRNDFDWACWVSMHKAFVPAALAWGLCLREWWRGRPAFPSLDVLPGLLITALIMQFSGNILFQLALGRIGLAVTVPLAFSMIIVTGGLMGHFVLKEPLSRRIIAAMGLVIVSIVLLNLGASEVSKAITGTGSWTTTLAGVAAACGAGFGYGFGGAMIRRTVARGAPVYAPVLVISTAGVVLLGPIGIARLGWETISTLPPGTGAILWTIGVLNAFSFFCNCAAFKRLPVVRVNLINASQAAMAAAAGVLIFNEPPTWSLVLGTLLTVLGLTVLGWSRARPA